MCREAASLASRWTSGIDSCSCNRKGTVATLGRSQRLTSDLGRTFREFEWSNPAGRHPLMSPIACWCRIWRDHGTIGNCWWTWGVGTGFPCVTVWLPFVSWGRPWSPRASTLSTPRSRACLFCLQTYPWESLYLAFPSRSGQSRSICPRIYHISRFRLPWVQV